MTLRKWITFASAAALIAGASACTENRGTSTGQAPADNTAQGRRGDSLPRARDAGAADTTGSGSATGVSGSTSGSSSTTPSDSSSSGSTSGTSDSKK